MSSDRPTLKSLDSLIVWNICEYLAPHALPLRLIFRGIDFFNDVNELLFMTDIRGLDVERAKYLLAIADMFNIDNIMTNWMTVRHYQHASLSRIGKFNKDCEKMIITDEIEDIRTGQGKYENNEVDRCINGLIAGLSADDHGILDINNMEEQILDHKFRIIASLVKDTDLLHLTKFTFRNEANKEWIKKNIHVKYTAQYVESLINDPPNDTKSYGYNMIYTLDNELLCVKSHHTSKIIISNRYKHIKKNNKKSLRHINYLIKMGAAKYDGDVYMSCSNHYSRDSDITDILDHYPRYYYPYFLESNCIKAILNKDHLMFVNYFFKILHKTRGHIISIEVDEIIDLDKIFWEEIMGDIEFVDSQHIYCE